VDGDGERVRLGVEGIHVESGEEEVVIDGGGISVEDGDKKLELKPGRTQGRADADEVHPDGAGIRVQDAKNNVTIELPEAAVLNDD